ncbi:MAG: hypothetical protein LUD29_01745 [Clostridia bacterium]|nr:hypothetical protein [Clostridia bacterium]
MTEDIFVKLDELSRFSGSRFGTEATRALLDALGSPDDALKIIHVAGTNGKGSVCTYLSAAFAAAGISCGTYLSPAVFKRTEQYLLDGIPCDENKLRSVLREVSDVADELSPTPSAFERETAAAFLLFYRENMEYAVVECGLGGLMDSTNAVNKKEFALISSTGLEHCDVLGDTIEEICAHKAGIIKNCPAIISYFQPGEALEFFSGFTATFSGEGLKLTSSSAESQNFSYDGEDYTIRMAGIAQCYNASVAIDCLRAIGVPMYAIKEGLSVAKISGRCDIREKNGKIYILDGAHNPEAFSPLKELLEREFYDKSITVIFGCLSDKDIEGNVMAIRGVARDFIAVRPDSHRAADFDKISGALRKHCARVSDAECVSDALSKAEGDVVVVCGSFTLLSEADLWMKRE